MKRRNFIQQLVATSGVALVIPAYARTMENHKKQWFRHPASEVKSPAVVLAAEKRIPLGWKAFPVSSAVGVSTLLRFPSIANAPQPSWLRLTAAIDFREEITMIAYLPESGTEIGQFDIRYAHPFQPFEIPVAPGHWKEIRRQGLALRMSKGTNNLWFFGVDQSRTDNLGLQPHLLIGKNKYPEKAFRENLLSMNSFSPFGWLGGNVQDALWEMSKGGDQAALQTLKQQLGNYLDNEKGIIFESPMTEPRDGTFNSIEDFLPFSAIVDVYPDHPSVALALHYLQSKENQEGLILSGNDVTTEGCYTLAYPLAALALRRNDPLLAQKALNQLRFRTRLLTNATTIFQRASLDGHQTYANWGRGVAWYLLGTIKTLAVLKDFKGLDRAVEKEVQDEYRRAVAEVSKWQNHEGLWCSFLDRSETGIDTSATAGIAAAIVWGVHLGLLDQSWRIKAQKSLDSLKSYLTPDGFLRGVSQINRGGEALQANGYRVISQFGMGLMAQLDCLLKR